MAVTYFGITNLGDLEYWSQQSDRVFRNNDIVCTCPGSGDQTLISLGVYFRGAVDTCPVRTAIYDMSFDLIAQGSAVISVASDDPAAWYDHTAFTDSGGDPVSPILTGGTNYYICTTFVANPNGEVAMNEGNASDGFYRGTNFLAGFPASIPVGDGGAATIYLYFIRAGVEPAAGEVTRSSVIIKLHAE